MEWASREGVELAEYYDHFLLSSFFFLSPSSLHKYTFANLRGSPGEVAQQNKNKRKILQYKIHTAHDLSVFLNRGEVVEKEEGRWIDINKHPKQ